MMEARCSQQTFRNACLTASDLIILLRHSFWTSSSLVEPELRHAMLVVVRVLLLLADDSGEC